MNEASKPPNGPERPGESSALEAVREAAREAVDRRVRAALEPPSGTAARIARRALDGEARPARAWVVRPAVAAVGLALAAVALAALLLQPRLRLGEDAPEEAVGAAEIVTEAPARGVRYSITNRGEVIVVQALDGGPSSLHANRATPEWRPSPPGRKLLVHGGAGP